MDSSIFFSKLKPAAKTVALDYLNGNDNGWKYSLQEFLENEFPTKIDSAEVEAQDDLEQSVRSTLFGPVKEQIEEEIYEILSQREVFNEPEWESKTKQFENALGVWWKNNADVIVSNIWSNYSEDQQYSRNPGSMYGVSDEDFF